jgi:hypothetical protein
VPLRRFEGVELGLQDQRGDVLLLIIPNREDR